MLLFLYRWDYCWKCEFATDVKRENYYYHDGEQLGFYEKSTFARNKEFQFIWKKLYSSERQMPYLTWRKLT